MKKLSIGFHPNEKRKNPKTNKTQIVMRLMLDGKKKEVRLPEAYDLSEKDLQKWNGHMQRVDAKNSDINDYLNGIMTRRKVLDLDQLITNKNYTPTEVVDKLLGIQKCEQEINTKEYAQRYLREEVENSFKEDGTKRNYRNAINQFCIFLQLKGWTKLPIEQFKHEHANAFKKFLETPPELLDSLGIDIQECNRLYSSNLVGGKPLKKNMKSQNTVVSSSTKIKNIRPIFEKAIDEDLINKNPFKKIKLTFEGEESSSLTPAMLKRVYDLSNLPDGVVFAKDLFLFMCFTGMSYVDTINLMDTEFEVVDGNVHLLDTKRRKKTGQRIHQVLSQEATKILSKYYQKGFAVCSSRAFPRESGESLNRKLKIIQNITNIPFDLSTKNGRITFKNLVRESNIQNPLLTRKLMGWGVNKSIEDLYDRFTVKDYLDAKHTFDDYLKKIINDNNCTFLE